MLCLSLEVIDFFLLPLLLRFKCLGKEVRHTCPKPTHEMRLALVGPSVEPGKRLASGGETGTEIGHEGTSKHGKETSVEDSVEDGTEDTTGRRGKSAR